MFEPGSSLDTRIISSYPISISTSLALETLFDPRLPPYDAQRIVPPRADLHKYQEMWFNVLTLFRNLAGSVDKNVFLTQRIDILAYTLEQEIEVIKSLFQVEGMGLCKPRFYCFQYETLNKVDPRIKLRQDNTEYQKQFKSMFFDVLKLLVKRMDILITDYDLPRSNQNALIMTHICYDLLNYKRFNRLDLLESNTGKVKSRNEWNSKYYPVSGRDMSHLPFLRSLLLVLGDKVLIHPSDIKIRKMILDISEQRGWTPLTTIDKIRQDFDMDIRDLYIRQFLNSL